MFVDVQQLADVPAVSSVKCLFLNSTGILWADVVVSSLMILVPYPFRWPSWPLSSQRWRSCICAAIASAPLSLHFGALRRPDS